jgi:hypothetical protein
VPVLVLLLPTANVQLVQMRLEAGGGNADVPNTSAS